MWEGGDVASERGWGMSLGSHACGREGCGMFPKGRSPGVCGALSPA